MQSDHFPKPPRLKSREVSSRFLSPSPSSTQISSPRRALSPLRQRQSSSPSRDKLTTRRRQADVTGSEISQGLWPSSSSGQNQGSLADHLGSERLMDYIDRKPNGGENSNSNSNSNLNSPSSLNRQNSSIELSRFEKKLNRTQMLKPVFGGSSRFAKERVFSSRDSNSSLPYLLDDQTVIPGRRSIDENMLRRKSLFGRRSEFTSDTTQESDSSDSNYRSGSPVAVTRRSGIEVSPKYLQSTRTSHLALKSAIKRAKSENGLSKWSLSPGRSGTVVESKESPSKTKGMGNLLSKGLELFKVMKSSSSSSSSPQSSPSNAAFISGPGVGDSAHHLRLLNNRLVQLRFVNAKSEATAKTVAYQAEMKLIHASASLFKLQQSVMQKRTQLAKQKMEMKMNYVLHSQIRLLERWGNIERQHISSISKVIESLYGVVCKLPLVEGATLDTNSATINLRQASDISTSIMSLISTFSPEAEKMAPILWELARVVTEERFLLDEFLELYGTISMLEAHERSLKCNLIQLKSHQQLLDTHSSSL